MASDPHLSSALKVICVGTSHRRVPVDVLERALLAAHDLAAGFARAIRTGESASYPFTELATLSTCNRVEMYAVAGSEVPAARAHLTQVLAPAGLSASGPGGEVYVLEGEAVARHLCRVAAGLDSMVLGEPQIAGQVARAFRAVQHENGGPPVLAALAQAAQRAGRRARVETGIGRGPASVSAVAVRIAAEEAGGLTGRRLVVVGAGKIGRLACLALRAAAGDGARITIVNRTIARAQALATRVHGEAAALHALDDLLVEADVVLASTSARTPLIGVERARLAAARRGGRPLVLLDIALPRNIAPEVSAINGMHLFGLDDLRTRLDAQLEDRRAHVPAAEAIVEEEVAAWLRSSDAHVAQAIDALYRAAELARRGEVARFVSEIGPLDEEARARLEHMTRSIVRRLLHEPAARIRAEMEPDRRRAYARLALALFGLDGPVEPEAAHGP